MILWNQEATFKHHWIASFYPFEWHSNVCHLIDPFESHATSCKRIKTTWRKKKAFAWVRTTMQTPNSDWFQSAQRITNKFFSQKTTNKIFMYLLAPSFCKILKKFLEPIHSYEDMTFSEPKWPICLEQNHFATNHYYFHLPIGPFHCAKF